MKITIFQIFTFLLFGSCSGDTQPAPKIKTPAPDLAPKAQPSYPLFLETLCENKDYKWLYYPKEIKIRIKGDKRLYNLFTEKKIEYMEPHVPTPNYLHTTNSLTVRGRHEGQLSILRRSSYYPPDSLFFRDMQHLLDVCGIEEYHL
jgi:hypothetical protein